MPRAHNGKQNREKIRTVRGLASVLPITASFRLAAGGEVELQERLAPRRTNLVHIVAHDRVAAVEADFAQALEDLLCAVRMRVKPAQHLRLERIKSAGAWGRLAGPVLTDLEPFRHRLRMQPER